jgi:ribosomal-protein-alanine N-acetyltransferase
MEDDMLKGTKIFLKPIAERDIEILRKWRNEHAQEFFSADYITPEQQKQWYEHYRDCAGRDYMWIIINHGGEFCGTIALYNITISDRHATIGRVLVLEDYRGRGYMEDAINLVTDYAFNILRLYKINLSVYLDNSKAMAVYSNAGFTSGKRPIMLMEQVSPDKDLWKKPLRIPSSYDEMSGDAGYESSCSNIGG